MSRHTTDIVLTQHRDALKSELKDVEEKIETVTKIKEILKHRTYLNAKVWLGKDAGGYQELYIEFDNDKDTNLPSFSSLDEIYDFGWHVEQVGTSIAETKKDRTLLTFHRNAD